MSPRRRPKLLPIRSLAAARSLDPQRLAVVVRHDRDRVAQHVLAFEGNGALGDFVAILARNDR